MSGTSNGATTNYNGTHWNQQSYFDFLTQRDVTWRAYYQDDMWAIFYFRCARVSRDMLELLGDASPALRAPLGKCGAVLVR